MLFMVICRTFSGNWASPAFVVPGHHIAAEKLVNEVGVKNVDTWPRVCGVGLQLRTLHSRMSSPVRTSARGTRHTIHVVKTTSLRHGHGHRHLATAGLLLALTSLAAPPAFAQTAAAQASRLYEDALARYEKSDNAGAVIQLKNALKADKNMLPVHVLLGQVLLSQGDVLQAEVALNEALRLGVNRAEVVVPLARALMAQGKPQNVLSEPRFSTSGLPTRTQYELQLVRASAATDLGDTKVALKAVEDARMLDAAEPGSWLGEVPIRIRAGQPREALSAADRAVALAPSAAGAHYARGEALHSVGNLSGAVASYDRALALKVDDVDTLIARAGAMLDLGRIADAARDVATLLRVAPADPRAAYLDSILAERQGKPERSRVALNRITALLDPVPIAFIRYRPQMLILGGMAHFGLQQGEKAKPYLEAVLKAQPGHPVSKVLARLHLADNNLDRASDVLESYLRGTPSDTQAMLLLASAQMARGRHARATQLMQDALKHGDQAQLRTTLGLSLVGRGQFTDGIKELEAAFAKDPRQLPAGFTLTALYMQAGQPGRATQTAQVLARQHGDSPAVQNLLGSALRQKGEAAAARAAFEQALKLDATFAPARINLARLDADEKSHDSAIARLSAVLKQDPRNVDALLALGDVSERMGQLANAQKWLETADDVAGPANSQPAIQLVDFHLRHGKAELARDSVKRAVGRSPESVPTLLAVARVALAAGDAAGARTSLTRASNTAAMNAPLQTQIALMQMQAADLAGASYTVDKVLADRPDFLPAQALRADIDIRQGSVAKAEQRAARLVTQFPKLALGHGMAGDAALARGQTEAATAAYRRAHDIDGSSASFLRLFRATHTRDRAAATRLAEQWIKTRPRDTLVLRALADSQLSQGQLALARRHYEALLAVTPADAEALNNLAFVLIEQRDGAALKVAEQALAQSPEAPHVIGTVGWAAFQAGQSDRAIQLLRDARLRDPSNADTRYFLGTVLAKLGRPAEAREELTQAVRGTTHFTHRAAAEKLLASLN